MELSFPFNSINGDRKYNAKDWARYFETFIGNGIFPNPSTNLQVLANNDMSITVKKGAGWIFGHIYVTDLDKPLNIDVADPLLDRIDRIVLALDYNERKVELRVKKGEPKTGATAPPLKRDSDIYELGLAEIRVNKGVASITQSSIKDTRMDKNVCGIVHGVVEQVDTTTLYNEYQAWIQEKKLEYDTDLEQYKVLKYEEFEQIIQGLQDEFDTWFATIQDILDENVAGNLLNMINDIPKVFSGIEEPTEIRAGDYWFKEVN